MFETLLGKQRALVFPVMCNGYIEMDYQENYVNEALGLWGNSGNFTFETTITPYDINGLGQHSATTKASVTASKKIMPGIDTTGTPANFQSNKYLSVANRLAHEMTLFHSTSLKIFLVNSTSHTENQPAEYKIKVTMTIDGTTESFTSPVAISPEKEKRYSYLASNRNGFDKFGNQVYEKVTQVDGAVSAGSSSFDVDSTARLHTDSQKVFIRSGFDFIEVGSITNISSKTVTLSAAYSGALADNEEVFLEASAEPNYINGFFHIAVAYNETRNLIKIIVNGRPILTSNHSSSSTFVFDEDENFYIGANGNGELGENKASTNKQFMGELHELAITDVFRQEFPTYRTITPTLNNTLVYMRFEEVDQ